MSIRPKTSANRAPFAIFLAFLPFCASSCAEPPELYSPEEASSAPQGATATQAELAAAKALSPFLSGVTVAASSGFESAVLCDVSIARLKEEMESTGILTEEQARLIDEIRAIYADREARAAATIAAGPIEIAELREEIVRNAPSPAILVRQAMGCLTQVQNEI